MRKQYRLDFTVETEELQEYLIAKHKVNYFFCGPPCRKNEVKDADFELVVAMGDDVAEYLEIFNKDALLKDKKLQKLLAKCSKFKA